MPHPSIEGLESLTAAQKIAAIEEIDLIPDDVAFFILDDAVSDSDILSLIDALEQPFAGVAYHRQYKLMSLLNYAVYAVRPNLVEALIEYGFAPYDDEYLGTSMEWALRMLSIHYRDEKRSDAASIVLTLNKLKSPAIFSSQNEELVEGGFYRHFYKKVLYSKQYNDLVVDFPRLAVTSKTQLPPISLD